MKTIAETMPELLLKDLYRKIPGIEVDIEAEMTKLKSDVGKWPDWCEIPYEASSKVLMKRGMVDVPNRMMKGSGIENTFLANAALNWKLNKVIYRFDEDLANELAPDCSGKFEVPESLLVNAPYSCVYIQGLPEMSFLDGYFATFCWDRYTERHACIDLLFLLKDGGSYAVRYPCSKEAVEQIQSKAKSCVTIAGEGNENTIIMLPGFIEDFVSDERKQACYKSVFHCINLLAYLCSEKPDIIRELPKPKIKGIGIAQNPKRTDVQYVGRYIGSILRKAKTERMTSDKHGKGGSVHPHMRRAHWHLYWTGKERKTPVLKWLHPIFVNKEYAPDVPTSLHGVE